MVANTIEEINVTVLTVMQQDYNFEKESYFSYIKAVDNEGNNLILRGYTIEPPHSFIEMNMKVYGRFVFDEKRKLYIFEFENYTIDSLEFKLFLKMLSLNKKTIESILKRYSYEEFTELLNIEHMDELLLIKGIGKKTALKIIKKYKNYKEMRILVENLAIFGFNIYDINRIYFYFKENGEKNFEDLAFRIVLNPYILLDVPYMDFHRIDEIAINQIRQIKSNSPIRIKEGIKWGMKELRESTGNTVFDFNTVFYKTFKITETDKFTLDERLFREALEMNLEEKKIIEIEDNRFSLKEDVVLEKEIYSRITETIQNEYDYEFLFLEEEALQEIEKFEEDEGIRYSREQKESILKILTSNKTFLFVNGYAGTGKTTTIKGAVRILLRSGKISPAEIIVCALAGTAANRAKNVIGIPYAKTIHSMLGIIEDKKTGKIITKFNENLKLPYKLIIVDESAMIDNFLFLNLLKAVDYSKTKIVFAGDIAQLPPVGWGNVFETFIKSDLTKDVKINFSKIFRQKEGMLIHTANLIRKSEVSPFLYKKEADYKDFYYMQSEYNDSLKDTLLKYVENDIKKYVKLTENLAGYMDAVSFFEVLSAKKENFLGVYHINRLIQRKIHRILFPDNDTRFVFSYYIIDFLIAPEEKKYYCALKIQNIIEKIKKEGFRTKTESDFVLEIEKKIKSAFRRNIFYYLEKFLRAKAENIFKYYGYYFNYKYLYREKDKVIHLKNGNYITFMLESYIDIKRYLFQRNVLLKDFKKDDFINKRIKRQRVYNGQIGIIDAIIPNLGIFVVYPFEEYAVLYRELDYETVNLAYSISIHKSQGQEYEKVYIPITNRHFFMFDNKTLYTSVTRAKNKVFLFSQKGLVPKAILKKNKMERKTVLQEIVKQPDRFF